MIIVLTIAIIIDTINFIEFYITSFFLKITLTIVIITSDTT